MASQDSLPPDISDGGAVGTHAAADDFEVLAAPATGSERNFIRLGLVPIACWRVDDVRFDFDSSVVLPAVRAELQLLADLIAIHTEKNAQRNVSKPPMLSLFGHADPVGQDDYNKALSGRRAAAIYGILTRRVDVWEDLYSNGGAFSKPASGDRWGARSIQRMLRAVFRPIAVDGIFGPDTRQALTDFQRKNGLAPDGDSGPATRGKLFRAYMDKVGVDSSGKPFQVEAAAGFLAHNADAAGKGDFQGCGEFNPVLIFSAKENKDFDQSTDKTPRNAANGPNRRVMALLFRPGSRIDPSRWPCPRANEGTSGCRKRFFSDGEDRRSRRLPDQDREYEQTRDTFACRFYDRISNNSPCDRPPLRPRTRLLHNRSEKRSHARRTRRRWR